MDAQAMVTMALGALGQLRGLAETFVDARDELKAREIRFQMLDLLQVAQGRVLALQEECAAYQASSRQHAEKVAELERAADDRERYRLREVGSLKALVYAADAGRERGEPAHYLCQPCRDAGKKVVLQPSANGNLLTCANDARHNVRLDPDPPRRSPSFGGGGRNDWMDR